MILEGNDDIDNNRKLTHYYFFNIAENVLLAFPVLKEDTAIREMATKAVRESLADDVQAIAGVGDALAACIDPDTEDQVAIDVWAKKNFFAKLKGDGAVGSSLYSRVTHTVQLNDFADSMLQNGCDDGFDGTMVEMLCGYAPEFFSNDTTREAAAYSVVENFSTGETYPMSVFRTLKINDAYFLGQNKEIEYNKFLSGLRAVGMGHAAGYDFAVGFVSTKFLRKAEEKVLLFCANGLDHNYTHVELKKLVNVFHPSAEFLARPEIVAVLARTEKEKKKGGWGGWGETKKSEKVEESEKKLVKMLDEEQTLDAMQFMSNSEIDWERLIVQIPQEVRKSPKIVAAVKKKYVLLACKDASDKKVTSGTPLGLVEQLVAAFPDLQSDPDVRHAVTSAMRANINVNYVHHFGDEAVAMAEINEEFQKEIDEWADTQIFKAKLGDAKVDMSALYRKVTHTAERDAAMAEIEQKLLAMPTISFKPEGLLPQQALISMLYGYGHAMSEETEEKARTILISLLGDGVLCPPSVYCAAKTGDDTVNPNYDVISTVRNSIYARIADGEANGKMYSRHLYSFVSDDTLRGIEEELLQGFVVDNDIPEFYKFVAWFQPSQEFLQKPDVAWVVKQVEQKYLSNSADTSSWGKDGHYDDDDTDWTPPSREERTVRWQDVDDSVDKVFDCLASQDIREGLATALRIGMTPEQITELITSDAKIRRNIEKFEERSVEQFRYGQLGEFLRVTGREMPITGEGLGKVLKKLMNDGMPTAAAECLKIADEHHVAMDDKVLRGKITLAAEQEQERRKKREPREIQRSREIPKAAHQLAAFFYVESRVLQNVDLVLQEIPYDAIDLPFATNLRLRELQSDLRRDIETVSLRLREYLMVACASEIRHQNQLRDRQFDVAFPSVLAHGGYPDAKAVFRLGTDEENITYLAQAEARFLNKGWASDYGGKKWAVIAETGMRLFRHPDDVTIMDYVFDLEHNTKAIFDKDASIIEQDTRAMEALKTGEVLNAKRYAKGNSRQLIRVLREVLPKDHALFDRLDRVVDRWMDVLRAIERSYAARGKEWKVEKYI